MVLFNDDDAEGTWIAFVDTLFNAMFIFAAMFALQAMLPHLKAETAGQAGINPGRMCATLQWPDALDVDLDLWARNPAGEVVFYKHKSGKDMDLLRDDMGNDGDTTSHHFETICSRSLTPGAWTFNAVYYGSHVADGSSPDAPVSIEVAWPQADPVIAPIRGSTVLHAGDETTMVDFRLDDTGKLVPSSVNHLLSSMMQ
jgi:hypothetical protein